MSETTGATGGYTVPEEVVVGIDAELREIGIFHMLAYRQPMRSETVNLPSWDIAASHSAGTSPLLAGMTLTWTQEGTASTESEPSFANAVLVGKNLQATVYASNQLVTDGGDALGAYLYEKFTMALEWAVERECFNGVLPGRPIGIVNAPQSVLATRAGSGHIAQADVTGMMKSLLPACYKRAIWCCSPTAVDEITKTTSYQPNMDVATSNGLAGALMARPLYVTEKLPAIGGKGDLVLFDPKQYALGTRGVDVSCTGQEPAAFKNNQTVYRLWWRGDGQPIPRGTATLADGTTTSSPFVVLNA